MQLCNECPKRARCIELCPRAEEYIDMDYTPRREALEGETGIEIDKVVYEAEWPEGEPELNLEDWKYLIKNYKMTSKQKKYIFLRYWKRLFLNEIANKYKVSHQTIDQTIRRFIDEQSTNS